MDSSTPPSPGPAELPPGLRQTGAVRDARTWELEMLISGAVLIALLRAPGLLDSWFHPAHIRAGAETANTLFILYYTGKVVVYILIASFVAHLLSRAYWVGLVGLHTAYPNGVRWDRLGYGAISTEVYREKQPSLEEQITKADRFCSTIFPLAFASVLGFLLGALLIVVLGFGALLLRELAGIALPTRLTLMILAILAAPALLLSAADRLIGKRLKVRAPRAAGALKRGIAFYYSAMAAWAFAPVLNVLMSNAGKTRVYAVYYVLLPLAIGFFFIHDVFAPRGMVRMDGYRFVPELAEEHGVDPRHYENLRGEPDLRDLVPTIQSDIVEEPFVRLFLPYLTQRHDEAMQRECPELSPVNEGGFRFGRPQPSDPVHRAATLDCIARLQRVFVDGVERRDLRLRFGWLAESGVRGMVAYIPVGELEPGEHLLTVDPPPRTRRDDERGRPVVPFQIPFWVAPR